MIQRAGVLLRSCRAGTTRVVHRRRPSRYGRTSHGNDDRQPATCPRRRPGLAARPDPARPLGREPARERRDVAAGRIRRLRPFDVAPAGDRGRRHRTGGRAPSGGSRAGDDRADEPGAWRSPPRPRPSAPAITGSSAGWSSALASELSITWDRGEPDPGAILDDLGTTFADRTARERAYLGWLGQTLVGARAGRAARGTQLQVGIPGDTRYTFDGAIATVLGPRDDALARVGRHRHARRHRHHAVVGGRDRRSGTPEPSPRP